MEIRDWAAIYGTLLKAGLLGLILWLPASHAVGDEGVVVESPVWDDRYDGYFRKFTERFFGPHFDWRWFKAQAIAESSLNANATSPLGAVGLMQILPTTYQDIQAHQRYFGSLKDPEWNIAGGIYYIKTLFRKWRGLPEMDRLYLSFASYNAGYQRILRAVKRAGRNGAVRRWEQIKDYVPSETRGYVERIRRLMERDSRPLHVAQLLVHEPY